jgi:protein SCO1/2
MTVSRLRIVLWVMVGLAAIGGVLLALQPRSPVTHETALGSVGGPFTLTGSDGKPFSSAKLNGRPAAIFFGFTHCPDVCPTTLARLVKLRKELGKGDDAMSIVFISIDPERDGPAEVGSYAQLFNAPIIGLTGSPADIERVKKQFGVYSAKAPQPGGGYSVDHSAAVFLMDRNGKIVATLSPEEGDSVALDKLRRIS